MLKGIIKIRLFFNCIILFSIASFFSCSDMGNEVQNQTPQITSSSAIDVYINQEFSYTATAQEINGAIPIIHFEDFASWMDTSSNTISGIPDSNTTDTSFIVIAENGLLADTLKVIVSLVFEEQILTSYTDSIQPIFNNNCAGVSCHIGGSGGGLQLDSYVLLIAGGNSGEVVIAGDPDNSILLRLINGTETPFMPLGGSQLSESDIQLISDWIDQGALDN